MLHNLTVELWPDASTRPPLYGPDPHSFHGMNTDRDKSALKYMGEWLDACARLGVPIVGVTHHEYSKSRRLRSVAPIPFFSSMTAHSNAWTSKVTSRFRRPTR